MLPLNKAPDSEPDGNDENSVQARWLKGALAQSTAKFKLVVVHHAPYTADEVFAPGYTTLRWPFKAWGANLVASGCGANYQRFTLDDLQYVNVGTGGAALRGLLPNCNTGAEVCAESAKVFGHGELIISSYQAVWMFVGINGEVIDRTTILL